MNSIIPTVKLLYPMNNCCYLGNILIFSPYYPYTFVLCQAQLRIIIDSLVIANFLIWLIKK